jgi:membrane-associated phospholipid phosphatase
MLALALLVWLPALPAPAQTSAAPAYHASGWDVVSVVGAGGLYFVPRLLGLPDTAGSCAPCDPATLPGIDRGSVRSVSTSASNASTVALLAVGLGAAYAGLHGMPDEQMHGNAAVLLNSAAWTATATEWLKGLVHRERPVMYTADAPAAATNLDNHKSFPSGHTAIAFALATSYLVIAEREDLPHRGRNAVLLYGGAVLVGSLRLVAGQHFPTDVLGGAALGTALGWLVPTIHP